MVNQNLAQIKTAVQVSNAKSGSKKWLELRDKGIGGSDVAAIVGLSRYESAYSLWAKKTKQVTELQSDTQPMYWGRKLEPVLLDEFEDRHPEGLLIRDPGTWAHVDYKWQLANPDGLFLTPDGELAIVEIKTARFKDDWADGVPAYYRTQVQWYLQTFGLTKAYVAVLFGGQEYEEFCIEANEFEQKLNFERAELFWNYVCEVEPPDWDGSSATLEAVKKMHPTIDPDKVCELGDLGVYWDNAFHKAEEAKAEYNELTSRVLDAMGDAKSALIYDIEVATRQSRNGGTPFLVRRRKGS